MNSTRSDRMLRILAICGIVGPITYAIVLAVLGVAWPGYDPVRQYMSELGAVDAPHAFLMNVLGFQLLGISMVALGFGLYRGVKRKGWATVVGVALILLAGASMITVGFSPCDPSCVNISPTGIRHAMTATIAATAMTCGILVVSLRFRRDERWRRYWFFSAVIAVVSLTLSPLPMLSIFEPWAGLLQRLGIGLALLWMIIISTRLSVRAQT